MSTENTSENRTNLPSAAILSAHTKANFTIIGMVSDLKPLWTVVRKHLGFDPSAIADTDLQTILTGMLATVEGIAALRTHASSAHGAGVTSYRIEPRHARLAIHAAHTITLFALETWEKRRKSAG